jgi:potassium efflux system protein
MAFFLQRGGFICALLLSIFMAGVTCAQDTQVKPSLPLDPLKAAEQQQVQRQQLEDDRAAVERLRQEVNTLSTEMPAKLQTLQIGQVTETMVEQARLDTKGLQVSQDGVQAAIANSERQIKDLGQTIRELEAQEQLLKNPAKDATEGSRRVEQLAQTQLALTQQRTNLELVKQDLANLREHLELLAQRLSLAQQWQSRVEEVYRLQQEQSRQEAQVDLSRRLGREQQAQLDKAAQLRARLDREGEKLSEAQRLLLTTSIGAAEEQAKLTQLDINLSSLDNELANWESIAAKANVEPRLLQDGVKLLGGWQGELQDVATLLQRRVDVLTQQKEVIERREELAGADNRFRNEEARVVGDLLLEVNKRKDQLQQQLSRLKEVQNRLDTAYKLRLSQNLLAREQLPGTTEEWQTLLTGLADSPRILLHQLWLSLESAGKTLANATAAQWLSLAALEAGLIVLVVLLRRYLNYSIHKDKELEDSSFVGTLALTVLRLLRRNLWGIGLAVTLLLAVWILGVPQPGLGIIITILLLWISIKIPINLAWLLLASPQLPPEQQRLPLYRQLFWILLCSGILTAITILAHLSALPKNVNSIVDRLFLGYWLLIFVLLARIRRFLLGLLAERYAGQFWFISLRLSSLFLPLSLLVASLLGVAGYLNLAWTVAWYLVVLASVLAGWLMIRGLFNDLVVVLKNYAVAHSDYGLLWTQDIINPLHKILDLILVLGAWAALFWIYDWYGDAALITKVWAFLDKPLFTAGGAAINWWSILATGVTFLVVIWFGQWSRAVTYRWIFSRITDLGVRHSLSVFTQYLIVLTGVLIILRILGLDLTTLTVFAGAVGVGIGFGMQAIANNFISGLVLLVERPLRSGDIVQVGNYAGEITRIGIRSLILKTWDNQEVIIPNSEVITHPFINWTHTDNIMRTILMIGVSYQADPHQVRELLEQVLSNHPEVLQKPEWAVLLWEFGDSAITFRVQYFTDLSESSILKVRSTVMFAIWDSLKQAGIEIPYPQRDLYIKEWPRALATVPPVQIPTIPVPLPKTASQ